MKRLLKQNAQGLVEGELFIRQQFFKELEISDQEMEQHLIAPTCYHYISHIYRQFAEPNLAIAFASLLPCPWLYHDIGKSLNLKPSPNPLYQQWIETYITDELEQQIREEGALVNQLYRESDETDKQNARCLPHQCSYGSQVLGNGLPTPDMEERFTVFRKRRRIEA